MQQLLNSRYTRIIGLIVGLGLVFFFIFWFIMNAVGMKDFPWQLILLFSMLGSGVLVYKFFARSIF